MSELLVHYETDGKVGIITMDRPAKLNAMNPELKEQLQKAFETADADAATSVVVLRAEGRSFCVGYDISGGDPSRAAWRNDALKWHDSLNKSLHFEMMPWYMRKPIIASVQGHAMGGGCELAMFCDLTICADNAIFGEPEIRFSSTGPGIVMPWIIGYKKARELLYFGDHHQCRGRAATRHGQPHRAVGQTAGSNSGLCATPRADRPRSADGDQAVDQPRRRRRRLPQRHAGGARYRRTALRRFNGGRGAGFRAVTCKAKASRLRYYKKWRRRQFEELEEKARGAAPRRASLRVGGPR